MKDETLDRAIEIKRTLEELEKLRLFTLDTYPQIRDVVNTACFSKETLAKFKEVIRHFVNEEKERLTKEFDEL